MPDHELYIKRALELAQHGRGRVSPNPMVGCVVVFDNRIIGEGWHQKYGGPHAEVNAIESVEDKDLLKKCTLYVTLEPCSHFGKTPPCADLIVQHQLKKVVICNVDSNPLVAGKGIQKLEQSGIEVVSGILDEAGRVVNQRFFTYIEKKRPFVILKWAQTADGFIARENYDSKWISNEISRKLVHKWRSEEDAVMVATKTALYDNPRLNVRDWSGNDPVRIVIDKNLLLPKSLHLFDQQQTTLCYNAISDQSKEYIQYVQLNFDKDIIPQILEDLYKRQVQSVIVEGGAHLLNAFIEGEFWDEARVFVSDTIFVRGISAPTLKNSDLIDKITLKNDELRVYRQL